jgi:hypothetical protein
VQRSLGSCFRLRPLVADKVVIGNVQIVRGLRFLSTRPGLGRSLYAGVGARMDVGSLAESEGLLPRGCSPATATPLAANAPAILASLGRGRDGRWAGQQVGFVADVLIDTDVLVACQLVHRSGWLQGRFGVLHAFFLSAFEGAAAAPSPPASAAVFVPARVDRRTSRFFAPALRARLGLP